MFHSSSPRLVLAASIVTAGCLLVIAPSRPAHAQDFSHAAQSPGTNLDSSDYGAGGHINATVNQATGELTGQVFDPQNTLRRKVEETYSTDGGVKHESERQVYDFGLKGNLVDKIDYKFDLKGGLSYFDNEHFGAHEERTWEQKTTYRPDGYDTSTWHVGLDYQHAWTTESTTYKPPPTTPGQPAKPNAQPLQAPPPSTMQVGLIFPGDFHAGETVTGSLLPASYAEGFKPVPGLREFTFPIKMAYLPNGSPSLSGLEIGVWNDGYWPVNPNGTVSLHIPINYTGSLQLQTRDLYSLPGAGPSSALLDIGSPVAAPAMPSRMVGSGMKRTLDESSKKYLVYLWNLAYDLQIEFNEAEDDKDDDYHWEKIADLESYEYYLWEEIDAVIESLPPSEVAQLANEKIARTEERIKTLEDGPQTEGNLEELKDQQGWTDFLDDELGHAHWLAGDSFWIEPSAFWANPVLNQGKLGAIRGSFYGDPLETNLHIGTNTIWPLAGTGGEIYFMPPINLTPGLNNFTIDDPGMPPTELQIFYMILTMWADQLNLHKGQSTTYYVKLDGLNGLPASAWSSSFDPTDLIGASESSGSSGASSAPGGSQSGYITLAVTNQSPGTITMQNTFTTLGASFFAPAGTFQISGPVGAIADGGFSILGVARAYLQPELALGYPQGSTPPASDSGDSLWNSGMHLDYKPDSTSGLYSLASCSPTLGDTPCTDGALPPNTALIGGTRVPVEISQPTTIDREALEKALGEALIAADNARTKEKAKWSSLDKVWDEVAKAAPKPIMDAYQDAVRRRSGTRSRLVKTAETMGVHPTPENLQNFGDAVADDAAAGKAEDDAYNALLLALNTELSIRLQIAKGQFLDAINAATQAQANANAAQQALNALTPVAPSPPSPPPPSPPPPPK